MAFAHWRDITARPSGCAKTWEYFMFMNFSDDHTNDTEEVIDYFYEDVYLQFGTKARIEIGDKPNYEDCSQLEIQKPTDWSSGSVEFEMNCGAFQSDDTVYVFLIRDDGMVSAGYPISLQ